MCQYVTIECANMLQLNVPIKYVNKMVEWVQSIFEAGLSLGWRVGADGGEIIVELL